MSAWINIKDHLPPRPGSYFVIVLTKDRKPKIKMLRVGKWTRDFGLSVVTHWMPLPIDWHTVTHWMPLPELPKEEA